MISGYGENSIKLSGKPFYLIKLFKKLTWQSLVNEVILLQASNTSAIGNAIKQKTGLYAAQAGNLLYPQLFIQEQVRIAI